MARQRIIPIRREYNRWVANQTLEDYALRFTAKSARRFSSDRISQTAIGAISFLALEAIGGSITLSYGTTNALVAIVVASLAILFVGLPIARYATRHGVDVDLLTRGASFGYIGSTITSLIYASFTFILFAIEASIMSSALQLAFGIPLWMGHIISALVVVPLVTHGIQMISRFQILTQPIWIVLNILPFFFIAFLDWSKFDLWLAFGGLGEAVGAAGSLAPFDIAKFGAASAVILALMTQIGEQVDFLRFLPAEGAPKWRHRLGIFLAGAGWVVVGAPKLAAGSFLAFLALSAGISPDHAAEPGYMYAVAFGYMIPNQFVALMLMAVFVVVSQLKINVMNAYAGSLAWSNFFSRLTHSHPGRVVWLLFNVAIALLLMELGIYRLLEETLGIFSIIAMSWLCTISADLFVNKPLGLAPPGIEFKRAHLYDINPVGVGSMLLATAIALAAHFGASATWPRRWRPMWRWWCASSPRPPSPGSPRAATTSPASRASSGRSAPRSPARSASIPSSPRTWPGARPMRRRSARSAVRSTRAATTCASRTRICGRRRIRWRRPSCRPGPSKSCRPASGATAWPPPPPSRSWGRRCC